MIETNMQPQQQDIISQQPSRPRPDPQSETVAGTGPTITCSICDAVYAPSLQQAPFLQYAQGELEATFMGMCHFCFRCRRAACPQCWDEVHGVCGSCVQEAGLQFRTGATPLDGLLFPPAALASFPPSQPQNTSLLVPVRNGRFYHETQVKSEVPPTDITTEPTPLVQPAVAGIDAPNSQIADRQQDNTSISDSPMPTKTGENLAVDKDLIDTPVAAFIPTRLPSPEESQETSRQGEAQRNAKKAKKVSRLELVLTWIVLVIVLALVVVIALAEFIPAVNAAILHGTHIDIRGEIAYLVHIVQQLFKR